MDPSLLSAQTSTFASKRSSSNRTVSLHRCRFPSYTPSSITALAVTPTTYDASELGLGGSSRERGVLAVGRSNGTVELMVWGGYQGWVNYRTLPCSFPLPSSSSSSSTSTKPISLLSHLTWTHQTTLSSSDLALYEGEPEEIEKELDKLRKGHGVRLFGVGGVGSELVEWEWGGLGAGKATGMIKSTLPTLPPIFALAASPSNATLAISCEDSTIRLLNILDGELELMGKIEIGGMGKVRALSLVWGLPIPVDKVEDEEDDEEEEDVEMSAETKGKGKASHASAYSTPRESHLLAGLSNSTIRRFDAPVSLSSTTPYRPTLRMTLDRLKGEHTVVWAIASLGDGTVVSGDSMGNVKFWDGEMGTQLYSFRGHKADVLCLGVGSDGTSIFTSGIDQKTVEYRQVSVTSSRGDNARWIQSSGRRLHSHDVRAIVISPPYEPSLSSSSSKPSIVPIMTSAGLDLSLILTPVAAPPLPTKRKPSSIALENPVSNNSSITFESTVHRRQSYVPQRAKPFSITTNPGENGRLLVGKGERGVSVWRLGEPEKGGNGELEATGWEKLIDLELKLQTNLISSSISPDGKWLVVSDLYETKLFRLVSRNGDLVPKRSKTFTSTLAASLPTSLGTGSSCITFSRDSSRLVLSTAFGTSVAVVQLPQDSEGDVQVLAVFGEGAKSYAAKNKAVNGTNGDVEMNGAGSDESDIEEDASVSVGSTPKNSTSIVALSVSADGKWLATADLERRVEVYDLINQKHLLTLPTPPSVPTSLAFVPTSSSSTLEPTLLLTFSNNTLLLYGLTSRRFHPWSLPLSSSKYNTLTDIREPSLGVTFEPNSSNKGIVLLVWGANWVGKIDLEELRNTNFGGSQAQVNGTGKKGKKQYRLEADRKRAREEDEPLPLLPSVQGGGEGGAKQEGAAAAIDIKVTRKYQPLCLFEFMGQNELVAVERTWYDLVGELPEAWVKSGVFGT